jgi:hypothetical protein
MSAGHEIASELGTAQQKNASTPSIRTTCTTGIALSVLTAFDLRDQGCSFDEIIAG